MLTLEFPSNALLSGISLVSVIATQSPWLARMARGSPRSPSARTRCLSWASTKIFPSGSTKLGVRRIGLAIATTL